MTATAALKEISSRLAVSTARLARFGTPLGKLLAFSPADEHLYPSRSVTITIEKAGFSLAYGVRLLGKPRVKGLGRYSFPEEGVPLPESLATSTALTIGRLRASKATVTLCIPKEWVVARTAEESLRLVPNSMREAALALGISRWRSMVGVVRQPGAAALKSLA